MIYVVSLLKSIESAGLYMTFMVARKVVMEHSSVLKYRGRQPMHAGLG